MFGHYKYNYNEQVIENGNTKITQKVFVSQELIGEEYERLRNYLKNELKVSESSIDTDIQIIIQASNRI